MLRTVFLISAQWRGYVITPIISLCQGCMCIHVEQLKITNQICLGKALLKAIIALKLISLTDSQKLNMDTQ